MSDIRSRLLLAVFPLLYSRLQLFHEPAGRALFGDAWHQRRMNCLGQAGEAGSILEIGAGEGRLIHECGRRMIFVRGVEPSGDMRSSATNRQVVLVPGMAQDIPIARASIDLAVATYPGSWIFDDGTWTEIDRVLAPEGRVWVLLGGTYERGPGAFFRSPMLRLAYGGAGVTLPGQLRPAAEGFDLRVERGCDRWGHFYVLHADRRPG